MDRVILVSNRLPVTVRGGTAGVQQLVPSVGGLVSGLNPLHERGDGAWIGYPGEPPSPETEATLAARRLVPIAIPDAEYDAYYGGYSNGAIWPLFHYALDRCHFDADEYEAYRRVNERFADAVAEHAQPGDTIWIQDYHLMLLPQLVRERVPGVAIGFFLHVPFPSSEIFRVLPQREEILHGLLGADLIGVHTLEYADNLGRSIRRLLGLESHRGTVRLGARSVRIEAHPLGIDVRAFRKDAFTPRADKLLQLHRERIGDRQLILGVDRLDYTKGLPLKLVAFAELLKQSPEWRERVAFIQLAVPGRSEIPAYREQRAEVEQLVGQINGAFGVPGRVPIQYMYRSVAPDELGALYRLADVAYVSPIRDGLNLVAKEYVACHSDGTGVLVLSEFAGAASELGEALRINPWDVQGTAHQLQRALEMPAEERRARMRPLYERVRANDVHRWVHRSLSALRRRAGTHITTPPLQSVQALAGIFGVRFGRASTPLLLLDYDGSLREFTQRPEDARPTPEILDLLTALTDTGATVAIISGRDRHTLEEWLGALPLVLVAEHGTWLRMPRTRKWQGLGPPRDSSWKRDVRTVLEEYTRRVPGAHVEEKSTALVWHYREADPTLGQWLALELVNNLEAMLMGSAADVTHGARIVEVRQRGFDKGAAYTRLLETLGPFDFVLAAGDDRTDEDLFASLHHGEFSVKVGSGPSLAGAAVRSPRSLRRLLDSLARARRGYDDEAEALIATDQ